jgi:hypothetical protein
MLVVDGPTFVLAGLSDWAWWPGAVLALIDILALRMVEVIGNVLLA